MSNLSRAAALIDRAGRTLAERAPSSRYELHRPAGGERLYWPEAIEGFNLISAEGGDKFGTYSIAVYQEAGTGAIVEFDNGNDDGKGTYSAKYYGETVTGGFKSLDDLPSVLKRLPQKLERIKRDAVKRLPQPKGWQLNGDVDLTVDYIYDVDVDTHILFTLDSFDDLLDGDDTGYSVTVMDNGGYEASYKQRRSGTVRSIRELDKLLSKLPAELGFE